MELKIEREMLFSDIQKQFNDCYPNLKLEFFEFEDHGSPPLRHNKISSAAVVGKLAKAGSFKQVDINKDRTVGDLENELLNMLGVYAQVFRKSAGLWIGTSFTDNWTLEKQNREASFLNQPDKRSFEQKRLDEEFDNE